MRIRSVTAAATALLVAGLVSAPEASAQVLRVGPTYQTTVQDYSSRGFAPLVQDSHFEAWGLMVGVERPGSWWAPHLWLQRYEVRNVCETPTSPMPGHPSSELSMCEDRGWYLSVGPALEFLHTGPVIGTALAQLDLGSIRRGTLRGSGGVQVGIEWGAFEPNAYAAFQRWGDGRYYSTVGLGMAVRFSWPDDGGDRNIF